MPGFEDIQSDSIEATEIAQTMGLDVDLLADPVTFNRFQEIVNFFEGKADKKFLILKIIEGQQKSERIDHLFQYIGFRKEHDILTEKIKEFDDIKNQLNQLEDILFRFEK